MKAGMNFYRLSLIGFMMMIDANWIRFSVLYTSEETEDQTLLITDPLMDETEKVEETDGTDSILLIHADDVIDESGSLGEVSLNDENVVVFHDYGSTEPQIMLQKKSKSRSSQKKTKKKSSVFMWLVFFSFSACR